MGARVEEGGAAAWPRLASHAVVHRSSAATALSVHSFQHRHDSRCPPRRPLAITDGGMPVRRPPASSLPPPALYVGEREYEQPSSGILVRLGKLVVVRVNEQARTKNKETKKQ